MIAADLFCIKTDHDNNAVVTISGWRTARLPTVVEHR